MHAILPLKDLVAAKSRLGGLLSVSERRALMQAMVEDVLSLLAEHPQVDGITLVSDDPGAGHLAAACGARHLDERSLGRAGLNLVLEATVDRVIDDGDTRILVLHGDLPLLGRSDISAVVTALDNGAGVVIGCDGAGLGTNLLAFTAASRPRLAFGVDSCARHRQAAQAVTSSIEVLKTPGIGLDVDEPADLLELLAALPGRTAHGKTGALLLNTPLGQRLSLALAGDADDDNRETAS